MSLHLTLAFSCSLLSSLLLVAPAFADEPPAPAPAPAAAAPVAAPRPIAAAPPLYGPPSYLLLPAQGPGMYGPISHQPVVLEERRESPQMIAGGALMTFVGVATTVAGVYAFLQDIDAVCTRRGGDGSCSRGPERGAAIMAVGVLAQAGGLTMLVLGARKVTTPRPTTSLVLRPTGAALRVTF